MKALFGAGCFWGVEEAFRQVPGVVSTMVGYAGGTVKKPSYEQVCSGLSGHVEVVLVEFNPAKITYEKLLEIFWEVHDPTSKNRQGPDKGTQYRSVIFYYSDEQKKAALLSMKEKQLQLHKKIVTEILPAPEFYKAEEYHQQYLAKKGEGSCHA